MKPIGCSAPAAAAAVWKKKKHMSSGGRPERSIKQHNVRFHLSVA